MSKCKSAKTHTFGRTGMHAHRSRVAREAGARRAREWEARGSGLAQGQSLRRQNKALGCSGMGVCVCGACTETLNAPLYRLWPPYRTTPPRATANTQPHMQRTSEVGKGGRDGGREGGGLRNGTGTGTTGAQVQVQRGGGTTKQCVSRHTVGGKPGGSPTMLSARICSAAPPHLFQHQVPRGRWCLEHPQHCDALRAPRHHLKNNPCRNQPRQHPLTTRQLHRQPAGLHIQHSRV